MKPNPPLGSNPSGTPTCFRPAFHTFARTFMIAGMSLMAFVLCVMMSSILVFDYIFHFTPSWELSGGILCLGSFIIVLLAYRYYRVFSSERFYVDGQYAVLARKGKEKWRCALADIKMPEIDLYSFESDLTPRICNKDGETFKIPAALTGTTDPSIKAGKDFPPYAILKKNGVEIGDGEASMINTDPPYSKVGIFAGCVFLIMALWFAVMSFTFIETSSLIIFDKNDVKTYRPFLFKESFRFRGVIAAHGGAYIATRNGVLFFDGGNFKKLDGLPRGPVVSLFWDAATDKIWARARKGNRRAGFDLCMLQANRQWKRFNRPKINREEVNVHFISGGLAYFSDETGLHRVSTDKTDTEAELLLEQRNIFGVHEFDGKLYVLATDGKDRFPNIHFSMFVHEGETWRKMFSNRNIHRGINFRDGAGNFWFARNSSTFESESGKERFSLDNPNWKILSAKRDYVSAVDDPTAESGFSFKIHPDSHVLRFHPDGEPAFKPVLGPIPIRADYGLHGNRMMMSVDDRGRLYTFGCLLRSDMSRAHGIIKFFDKAGDTLTALMEGILKLDEAWEEFDFDWDAVFSLGKLAVYLIIILVVGVIVYFGKKLFEMDAAMEVRQISENELPPEAASYFAKMFPEPEALGFEYIGDIKAGGKSGLGKMDNYIRWFANWSTEDTAQLLYSTTSGGKEEDNQTNKAMGFNTKFPNGFEIDTTNEEQLNPFQVPEKKTSGCQTEDIEILYIYHKKAVLEHGAGMKKELRLSKKNIAQYHHDCETGDRSLMVRNGYMKLDSKSNKYKLTLKGGLFVVLFIVSYLLKKKKKGKITEFPRDEKIEIERKYEKLYKKKITTAPVKSGKSAEGRKPSAEKMAVKCENCGAESRVAKSKIPDKGAYAKCKKCGARIFIKKDDPVLEEPVAGERKTIPRKEDATQTGDIDFESVSRGLDTRFRPPIIFLGLLVVGLAMIVFMVSELAGTIKFDLTEKPAIAEVETKRSEKSGDATYYYVTSLVSG